MKKPNTAVFRKAINLTGQGSDSSDRMHLRTVKSWGCIVGGLFFSAVGGAMVYFRVPVKDASDWTVQAFGGGLVLIGVRCLFARSGAVLHRRQGTVTKWWGLLLPLFKSARRVSPTGVHLGHACKR